jgi:hypothetical protein
MKERDMRKELLGVGDRLVGIITPAGDHYRAGARGVMSIGVNQLPGPMGFYLVANIIYETDAPDLIIPLHLAQEIFVSNP